MKVCIIGTNGFLATAIGQCLSDIDGCEILACGRTAPSEYEFTAFKKIDINVSILDPTWFQSSDIIIYCAGAGIQSQNKDNPKDIYTLNTETPLNLCIGLREVSYTGTFITFGSVFEMGATSDKELFTEQDITTSTCEAPNDYVVSKRLLTRFVSSYKRDFRHLHFIIPTIYGSGENPNRLIPYTVHSIKSNQPLHFTSGSQIRQYLHVRDASKAIVNSIKGNVPGGIYNLSSTDVCSVKEIVEYLFQLAGKKLPMNSFGQAQRQDACMQFLALNGSKLKNFIGEYQSIDLSQVLTEYFK
jgi:nucleoside-diphosphate-sugar epimerase